MKEIKLSWIVKIMRWYFIDFISESFADCLLKCQLLISLLAVPDEDSCGHSHWSQHRPYLLWLAEITQATQWAVYKVSDGENLKLLKTDVCNPSLQEQNLGFWLGDVTKQKPLIGQSFLVIFTYFNILFDEKFGECCSCAWSQKRRCGK